MAEREPQDDLPFDPNASDAEVIDEFETTGESEKDPPAEESPERDRGVTPDELDRLAKLPGVYIMRDGRGKVVYIGKAGNLHSRVRSYFTKAGEARFNVRYLMRHVQRVETIITANEKEAFLLENTLIKKHQPRYNIRLRDDKTYVSVRINMNHEWPRAVVMRRRGRGARAGGDLPGTVCLGGWRARYAAAAPARVPDPLLPRQGADQPHTPLPAASHRPLLRALCAGRRQGRVSRDGRGDGALPQGQNPRGDRAVGGGR